ncbi:TPA: beta-lactamase family protein [Legionella pneumophila]|nr:beta-lactamase family protein [Legionella pneumophila]HBD7333520.1 beta-lactamase family protein [Legionella pneumophila]HBI5474555.1 beta-lactamase family protein [Legionella pneumophila]HEN5527433.1 beta-lactamase family protein [Legionella pneumophila]HEN5536373.1 beta-lactamase family protein [Legionella pneumophila]
MSRYVCKWKLIYTFFIFIVFNNCLLAFASPSLTKQLHTILKDNLSDSLTPGAVLLISSPDLGTISVAAGLADKENDISMNITDSFRLASMSKTFLAVTVLKLVADKQLNLDDHIADLLPDSIDIERIPNGDEVTVQQLLQMRSGIPNYTDYDSYSDLIDTMADKEWTPEECIKLVYDQKPNFKPGTAYEYSNTNYLLLQLIIENLTGESYAESIKKYILKPLRLKNTYIEKQEFDDDHHYLSTHGYTLEDGKVVDITDYDDGFGLADGGIISTAEDINIFVQALLKDKILLPPNYLTMMLTFPDDYGFGIGREEINGEIAWSHSGASSGYQGQYYYFPDQQLTVVILTNYFGSEIIEDIASQTLSAIDNSE